MNAPSYFEHVARPQELATIARQPIHVVEHPPEETGRFMAAWRVALAATMAGAALALTGCETLRQPEEMAWQAMHAIDVAQTLEIPGSRCLREGHPLTSLMIGRQPTTAGVVAWGVAGAGVHLLVSDQLQSRGLDGAYAVWQFVSIGDTAMAVGKGYGIGIRIGKPNKGAARCAS